MQLLWMIIQMWRVCWPKWTHVSINDLETIAASSTNSPLQNEEGHSRKSPKRSRESTQSPSEENNTIGDLAPAMPGTPEGPLPAPGHLKLPPGPMLMGPMVWPLIVRTYFGAVVTTTLLTVLKMKRWSAADLLKTKTMGFGWRDDGHVFRPLLPDSRWLFPLSKAAWQLLQWAFSRALRKRSLACTTDVVCKRLTWFKSCELLLVSIRKLETFAVKVVYCPPRCIQGHFVSSQSALRNFVIIGEGQSNLISPGLVNSHWVIEPQNRLFLLPHVGLHLSYSVLCFYLLAFRRWMSTIHPLGFAGATMRPHPQSNFQSLHLNLEWIIAWTWVSHRVHYSLIVGKQFVPFV